MPLTDIQIRKAKAAEKPYKLNDGAGLHLYVSAAGGKSWRYRYELNGSEKLLTIGGYPEISLADAREARQAARALVRAGRDPSAEKKAAVATEATASVPTGPTFEQIAREWHELNKGRWTETHSNDVLGSLEKNVFPEIGADPIDAIAAPRMLEVLRKVEARGSIETARRIRQRCSAAFAYAIASGRATLDPAAQVMKAMAPLKKGRQPAITDLEGVRKVLQLGEWVPAHPVTKLALRVLALTAIRPGELRGARWDEFKDLEGAEPLWLIPAERMKMKKEHAVPLARQTVEALLGVKALTGRGTVVFPMLRNANKPLSENAIGYLLNRAGYHGRHVPHGWRAAFSTIMNERHPHDRSVIDLMLAHAPKDKVEGAYNRAEHMARRRELAQIWADLLMVGQVDVGEMLSALRR